MSDLVRSGDSGLIGLIHGQDGFDMPTPFERDIFLFDSYVAGTSFVDGVAELEPSLKIDDRLNFFREPDNPHDPNAIVIKNADGVKVGYVPKRDNAVFSRLMDAGKLLFGRISGKEMRGTWLNISIKIYLHE